MNTEERAFIQNGFDSLSEKIDTHKEFLNKIIENNDKALCEKITKLDTGFVQHDKRINKLETSFAFQIGRIAAISAMIGGVVSVIVAVIGVK
jgi:pantothenate kinase